ncbi:hypothetical protein HWV62_36749 [Athelia sp. TMB]|nr:hypothetical protein HWV62_36749 [Athelia sp. TMB]
MRLAASVRSDDCCVLTVTSESFMPSLPTSSPASRPSVSKMARRAAKSIMKSHHLEIPKYDLPLRIRPWFLLFTFGVMLLLAFLGFTNFSRSLPLNDKLLHFICFCLATGVFYFIFDVEEEARRIWFWRHTSLLFTAIICFFFGGIGSEIVQSLLPYKEFQFGDVVANLLGSSIGLYIAYNLERYYRHRREISRLYRPLDMEADSDGEEDRELLPSHYVPTSSEPRPPKHSKPNHNNLSDVWDEREELFGIGDESDEEDGGGNRGHAAPAPPKITVTAA